ncbi:TPA: CpaF family protein [Burkholderia vietnamiensis]|uniref:CpaF family protein n=1 Tax=Burkholderia vietnamiensis TaxID=60552 RepID=UPI001B951B79|nr:ATPase, T2SS/T4P/T4SS family [Burkholderia vietnamiensis]MBR8359570.1 CpaF family protein [Burkholderia vietnamiensis]UKV71350.1 Flp pilus assembly complex ATPase component TadA [Burkholderia vietnamiensis]HDR9060586.1 CpaF family protein [Burkholderia vietnamiensis]HDR9157578.1 CpaF family protein [Burkholderia vietnamiensis]
MSEIAENPLLKVRPLEEAAVNLFFASLSSLVEPLEAPDVAEIMVNDFNNVWVESRGVMRRLDVTFNQATLQGAIHALAASVDKSAKAGTSQGIINGGHKNLRIAAVMRPTAIDGHALAIRKHRDKTLSLADYVSMGAFSAVHARREVERTLFPPGVTDEALRHAFTAMVQGRCNVLVAGGTSSGKTTLLNALNAEIPPDERVITIEDTMELKLSAPNRVRLLSNPDKGVTTQVLVALCLRFRPDRIIVGEVRSGEAYDFIQALSTGHDGGMGSIHSNDARGALSRLESLAMLGIPTGSRWELTDMRKAIADCFNYVIHMRRTGDLRHVSEVLEIKGFKDGDYVLKRVF